MKLIVISIR